ncbi:hypothetical protein DP49_5895 [Burkholderia pseudomallei]|nr:hypothetical protein DP49_5895 [Burkholderia pseudomallei]
MSGDLQRADSICCHGERASQCIPARGDDRHELVGYLHPRTAALATPLPTLMFKPLGRIYR